MTTDPSLLDYRRLPYTRTTERVDDEDGVYYVCRYPDLPGLSADGLTPHEAKRNAELAFDDYILARLHFNDPIPEPEGAERVRRMSAEPELVASALTLRVDLSLFLTDSVKRAMHRAIEEDNYVSTISQGDEVLVA